MLGDFGNPAFLYVHGADAVFRAASVVCANVSGFSGIVLRDFQGGFGSFGDADSDFSGAGGVGICEYDGFDDSGGFGSGASTVVDAINGPGGSMGSGSMGKSFG